MTENHHSGESMSKRFNCYGMCGGKNSRIFCGIFLIVIGLFLFGKRANWFSAEFMILFWPLVLILTGIWFIAMALKSKKDHL
jgi:uncharacterized membrane protein HdeD (DUF308 family)